VSRLLLLSASPRRRALLQQLGLAFEVCPVAIDETPRPGEPPAALAERLAREKAAACPDPHAWGIAADTVVALGEQVFGKPADAREAAAMLQTLRGRWHDVYTAVAVRRPDGQLLSAVDHSRVRLREFSEDELAAYLASGDPFDKAGGYAIQHEGFRPVAEVVGARDTVIGLPTALLWQLLAAAGYPGLNAAADRAPARSRSSAAPAGESPPRSDRHLGGH
jgi:septum formation protein